MFFSAIRFLFRKEFVFFLVFSGYFFACDPDPILVPDEQPGQDDTLSGESLPVDSLPVDGLPIDSLPVDSTAIDSLPVEPLPNDSLPVQPVDPQPDTTLLGNRTPVEVYGQLSVSGNKIVNQHGNSVQLRGMSFFWSQWIGKYYNYDCVKWLRDDWRCTVVRAAMAVESGGYLTNPDQELAKVKAVVDAAIDLGLYVIIDWHDHHAESHRTRAVEFFTEMARLYGNYPNVIYETFNEPLDVSWKNVLKPYHEAVIAGIRQYDPDNIVICGTRNWSQQVSEAAQNPLSDPNVAYALHYYASTHKQWLRNTAKVALDKGAALFVSEYGTTESSGTGYIDVNEAHTWWDFLDEHQVSWCNWSVADKNENSAALLSGASSKGGWTENRITTSGKLVRDELRLKNPSAE